MAWDIWAERISERRMRQRNDWAVLEGRITSADDGCGQIFIFSANSYKVFDLKLHCCCSGCWTFNLGV